MNRPRLIKRMIEKHLYYQDIIKLYLYDGKNVDLQASVVDVINKEIEFLRKELERYES